jgi:D-beta-D-heptose 7-phosphate kinase/D-beta-D-heptose 1-phosphate adenosyltransferase
MENIRVTSLSQRLHGHLDRFAGARVLVIGDLMLDHYVWGRVQRISPEAPVPVVDVTSESVMLGGAGNVFLNLSALGASVQVCGVVGQDAAGETLLDVLRGHGASVEGIVCEEGRPTTQKTRVVAHQQQVVRFDREFRGGIAPKTRARLLDYIDNHIESVRCVVVSDYAKGVISDDVMKRLMASASRRDVTVMVDPKVPHMAYYRGAHIVTPNHLEASQATGIEIVDDESLRRAGRQLLESLGAQAVLVTRGEHGMSLFEADGAESHIPTVAKQVFDVTGAGDTVIATLAAARAVGADWPDAATLANYAAGYVVGLVGTATVKPDALHRQIDDSLEES